MNEVVVEMVDRNDRITVQRKTFRTAAAMRAWLDQLEASGRLLEILAFAG